MTPGLRYALDLRTLKENKLRQALRSVWLQILALPLPSCLSFLIFKIRIIELTSLGRCGD